MNRLLIAIAMFSGAEATAGPIIFMARPVIVARPAPAPKPVVRPAPVVEAPKPRYNPIPITIVNNSMVTSSAASERCEEDKRKDCRR